MSEEQSVQDVSGESSAPAESSNPEQSAVPTAPVQEQKEQYVPYDRFRELVEQKNEYSRRVEAAEKDLRDVRDKFEKFSKGPSDDQKIIERFKGIDPDLGKWAEMAHSTREELASLKQWKAEAEQYRQQQQAESVRTQASAALERLQGDHKVDKTLHEFYIARIKEMAQANPQLGLKDLPGVYKGLHDTMGKFLETQKRAQLNEYSEAKKTDSKVPTPAKGNSPKPALNKSKNPDDLRAEMKKEMVAALRKNRES